MDTRTFNTRTLRIRELNDVLRAKFLTASGKDKVFLTTALTDLVREDEAFRRALLDTVPEYSDFTDDNDPYGEHDMAFFECNGKSVFWKINYYDLTLSLHSPDESDPAVTCRVLTVGLADEY